MTKEHIQKRLIDYIAEKIFSGPASELSPGTDLLANGVLDSVSVLQMVDFVEAEFAIQFQAHEVDHENFQTVELLSAFLLARR